MISYKLTFLFIYFAILIFIGIYSSKKVFSLSDYYVGGKKLGYWIAALSARATGESGWLLIGVTGMGAIMGGECFLDSCRRSFRCLGFLELYGQKI